MKIVALEVQRFGCVRKARLELSRQLNVLYGPNDIGKSTLVQAMRAALLLPHNSSAYRDFLPWQEPDATPEVRLTFEVTENGLPRYYRVHKRFGHSAHLAWSNDNRSYSDDTRKAREVDEKLRQLLQWGVPAAGSGRGMPESFLAKVLMASQPEVTGILAEALTQDKDPSGKNRIMAAMEAMLEDPLFKKVLGRAIERVNVAYSASGRERKGKGSPWVELRDKINLADEEVRRLQALSNQSAAAIAKLRALEDEVLRLEADCETAKVRDEELKQRWQQQQELESQQSSVDSARVALEEQEGKLQAVEQLVREVEQAEALLVTKKASAEQAQAKVDAAKNAHDAAEERVRALESDNAAREVALKRSQLKEREAQLEAGIADQIRRGERAEAAGKAHVTVGELKRRVTELEVQVAERDAAFQTLQSTGDEVQLRHEQARQLVRFFRYRENLAALQIAEEAASEAAAEQQRAEQARQQAEQLQNKIAAAKLPDADHLERLRQLHHELQAGQAALNLGLTAIVTPESPPLEVEVVADDVVRKESLSAAANYTAREALTLKLPGATIELTAAAALRVQELRVRWREVAEPVLQAAGVSSFAELESAANTNAAHQQKCQGLREAATVHEATAAKLAGQAGQVVPRRQAVEEARRALPSGDLNELERQMAQCESATEAARGEQDLERQRSECDKSTLEARGELQNSQAELSATRTRLESAEQAYRDAAQQLQGDWQATLEEVVREVNGMKAELTQIKNELATLDGAQNEELATARDELVRASEALDDAIKAVETEAQAVNDHERALASLRTRLEVRQEAVEAVDVEGSRQAYQRLEQGFTSAEAAFLAGGPKLSSQDIEEGSTRLEQAKATFSQKSSECLLARGGLIEVGGNVVEEELREAEEALDQRKRDFKELEIEFKSWKLLQDTLREAEKAQATHLGERLGAPLQTRFSDLTGGRYTHIDVGTDLATQGFTLAGDLRPVSALSAGTQEQLSTLFRLCLAEALETAVVLDDHLSQTDSHKMQWFRDALDEVSQKAQILVISCWPEHYQLPLGKVDTAKKIDAGQVVERY